MRKTLINKIPNKVPQNMQHLIAGADIYDSSSSPEARVYFIDKDGGYYLKCANAILSLQKIGCRSIELYFKCS